MKKSIFLFLLIAFSLFQAKGQSDSAHTEFWRQYRGLISPKLSTGVLADVGEFMYSFKDDSLKVKGESNSLIWLQYYNQYYFSSSNKTNLLDPDSMYNLVSSYIQENKFPILILKFRYNRIKENAISAQLIDTTNGIFTDLSDSLSTPFELDTFEMISIPFGYLLNDSSKVIFVQPLIVQNFDSIPPVVQVNGINAIENNVYSAINEELDLEVSVYGSKKRIKLKNISMQGVPYPELVYDLLHFNFSVNQYYDCEKKIFLPNTSSSPHGGEVSILKGFDTNGLQKSKLSKVIIFTDGIDFGVPHKQEGIEVTFKETGKVITIRGGFGIAMLLKGQDYDFSKKSWVPISDYPTFEKAPEMIRGLRAQGYDFIFLDFNNGATCMETNALVLIDLIKGLNGDQSANSFAGLNNLNLLGNLENISVIGPSMGGQVAKYALLYMEQNNIKSCVNLYGSFDSPHYGANISVAMQSMIVNNYHISSGARDTYERKILPAATRQLLNSHVMTNRHKVSKPGRGDVDETDFGLNQLRIDFLNEITLMGGGVPKYCYSAAAACGSWQGIAQFTMLPDRIFFTNKTYRSIIRSTGYFERGINELTFDQRIVNNTKVNGVNGFQVEAIPGGQFWTPDDDDMNYTQNKISFIPTSSALMHSGGFYDDLKFKKVNGEVFSPFNDVCIPPTNHIFFE